MRGSQRAIIYMFSVRLHTKFTNSIGTTFSEAHVILSNIDLVQEHITFKCEMTNLVHLHYSYRACTKAEDEAMNSAFGARGKRRLNKDEIKKTSAGFSMPDL
ncbi:hypothetical protein ACJX0J_014700 [Zea mays]